LGEIGFGEEDDFAIFGGFESGAEACYSCADDEGIAEDLREEAAAEGDEVTAVVGGGVHGDDCRFDWVVV